MMSTHTMNAANTILIADDHALLRDGLRALLSVEQGLSVIAETDNGRDAIALACSLQPNIVLMDLSMPGIGGIDAIAEIKRRRPNVRILVVTMHTTDEFIQGALRAGATGYLLKTSGYAELLTAMRTLLSGKVYLDPAIANRVFISFFSGGAKPASAWETLTVREREILKLVAEGNSNKHIATYLCRSVKTVEKHRASLMHKLGLRNASMLTAYAIDRGIVSKSASCAGFQRPAIDLGGVND